MMTALKILIFLVCYLTASSANPVKTGVSILMASSLLFTYMFLEKGLSWFSWMFLMLFMGGVLIIFMILSSISPNEKSMKMDFMDWILIGMLSTAFMIATPMKEDCLQVYTQLKWFYQMSAGLIFITIIIALYFFMFVTMLSEDKASMRTEQC